MASQVTVSLAFTTNQRKAGRIGRSGQGRQALGVVILPLPEKPSPLQTFRPFNALIQ